MYILDLPNIMLIEIFEFLSYDEVAKNRLVCRSFNEIAQDVLNRGFNKVIKQHNLCFKRIKAVLPRRESERRNHCLARHADILTSVETRISMLSMTYTKFMDGYLCCFIPGRVLDEIFRILRLISKANKPLRPHEVLQELRDISSMAIEHFDEKIAPTLARLPYPCRRPRHIEDTIQFAASNITTNISFSGMRSSGPIMLNSSAISIYGDNTISRDLKKRLGITGEQLDENSPKSTSKDVELPQTSLTTTPKLTFKPQHPLESCSEARKAMSYFKNLEIEFKKNTVKLHRMQQIQNQQNTSLQQTLNTIAELRVEITELKKRLEDVDGKNREISANIKQISGGELTEIDNINNTTTTANNDGNSDVECLNLSLFPSTSSAKPAKMSERKSNKRSSEAKGDPPPGQMDDTEEPEDISEVQGKKPKMES